MLRATVLVLLAVACGPGRPTSTDNAGATTDSLDSTAEKPTSASTTGHACVVLADLTADDRVQLCAMVPWQGPQGCPPQKMPPDCGELLAALVKSCPEKLTACDYTTCAKALAASTCGTRPDECEAIVACVSA